MKTICKNIAFSKSGECLMGEKCICEANKLWLAEEEESPSPVPPIPHDIISFWDEVLKKPIPCPDESGYFEWCFWMLKNEHPVHQIQLENEVDKVVYTVGDKRENGKIKELFWRENYWGYKNEKGDTAWIDGPIKGDIYHRDRFQRKSEESPSPSPGLRWTSIKDELPVVGRQIMLFAEYLHRGKPSSEMFIGWLGENGECYKGYDDEDYGWTFEECITYWAPLPLGPQESPSPPGEQDKDLMAKAIRMRDAYNAYIHTLSGELFVFRGGKDRGIDHFKEQQDARYILAEALKPFIGTDLQPSLSPEAPLRGEQVADPISLYKASIGVSELSAEKGEQVEGKAERKGCAKPNCDCIEKAEEKAGGPVKSYPYLHCDFSDAKKAKNPSPLAVEAAARSIHSLETVLGPSVEADQQVPEEIQKEWEAFVYDILKIEMEIVGKGRGTVVGHALAAEKIVIAMYHKMQEEVKDQKAKQTALVQEIAALKESFKSSIYKHGQNMEIVKGERDELRDLLNILNEGYSDHFTKFLNDRIYEALNKFTNNTKDI